MTYFTRELFKVKDISGMMVASIADVCSHIQNILFTLLALAVVLRAEAAVDRVGLSGNIGEEAVSPVDTKAVVTAVASVVADTSVAVSPSHSDALVSPVSDISPLKAAATAEDIASVANSALRVVVPSPDAKLASIRDSDAIATDTGDIPKADHNSEVASGLISNQLKNLRPHISNAEYDPEVRGASRRNCLKHEEDWEISGEENRQKVKMNMMRRSRGVPRPFRSISQKIGQSMLQTSTQRRNGKLAKSRGREDPADVNHRTDGENKSSEQHPTRVELMGSNNDNACRKGPFLQEWAILRHSPKPSGNITRSHLHHKNNRKEEAEKESVMDNKINGLNNDQAVELHKEERVLAKQGDKEKECKEENIKDRSGRLVKCREGTCNGGEGGSEGTRDRGSVPIKTESKKDITEDNTNKQSTMKCDDQKCTKSQVKCSCEEKKVDYKKNEDKSVTPAIEITEKSDTMEKNESQIAAKRGKGKLSQDLKICKRMNKLGGFDAQVDGNISLNDEREVVVTSNMTEQFRKKRFSQGQNEGFIKERIIRGKDKEERIRGERRVMRDENEEGREISESQEELLGSKDEPTAQENIRRKTCRRNNYGPELVEDNGTPIISKTAEKRQYELNDYDEKADIVGLKQDSQNEENHRKERLHHGPLTGLPDEVTRRVALPEDTEHDRRQPKPHKYHAQETDEWDQSQEKEDQRQLDSEENEQPPAPSPTHKLSSECHPHTPGCLPKNGPAKTPWGGGSEEDEGGAEYEDALNGKLADKIVEVIMAKVHKSKHLEGELKLCPGPNFNQFQKAVPLSDGAESNGSVCLRKLKENVMQEIAKAIDKLPMGGGAACVKLTPDLAKYLEWLLLDQGDEILAEEPIEKQVHTIRRRKNSSVRHRFLFPGRKEPAGEQEWDDYLDETGREGDWWSHANGYESYTGWVYQTPSES